MAKKPAKSDAEPATKGGSKPSKSATPACVLLTGPDVYQQHKATADLKAALHKQHGDIDVMTFDGQTARAADVLDECRSFGLMAIHKLVIVDNAEAMVNADTREMFARYAAAPSEAATLLLRAGSRWYKSKFDDLVHKVVCDGMSNGEAVAFALKAAKEEHRASLDQDAAELLVERLGPEAGMINAELAKLAVASITDVKSKEPPLITIEVVQQFVGMRKEDEAWAIQQTVLLADRETIIEQVRRMIEVARLSPVQIHWSLTDLARKLHTISAELKSGANEWALAKSLKLWGPSTQVLMDAGKRIDPERARKLLRLVVEADHRVKTGLADHERAIERLCLQFTSVIARRPAAASSR